MASACLCGAATCWKGITLSSCYPPRAMQGTTPQCLGIRGPGESLSVILYNAAPSRGLSKKPDSPFCCKSVILADLYCVHNDLGLGMHRSAPNPYTNEIGSSITRATDQV